MGHSERLCLQVLAVYVPALQRLLGTSALAPAQLAAVVAVSAVGFVAVRLQTTAYARRPGRPDEGAGRTPC